MNEDFFNFQIYQDACPACKSTLKGYSIPLEKKVLGISLSIKYKNIFICESCNREYSEEFVQSLLAKVEYENTVNRENGISVKIKVTEEIKGNQKMVTTHVATSNKNLVPVFEDDQKFVLLISKVIYVFRHISNDNKYYWCKIAFLDTTYGDAIETCLEKMNEQQIDLYTTEIENDYALFCDTNAKTTNWFLLSVVAKLIHKTNFVPNEKQLHILKEMMKIYGIADIKVETTIAALYDY
jgi:hypothetical protein